MAIKNVLTSNDFYDRDFEVVQVSNVPKIALKTPATSSGSTATSGATQSFAITAMSGATLTSTSFNHLKVKNGIGVLHLDFTAKSANGTLGGIASGSPVFVYELRGQTWDGGFVWLSSGSRTISFSGLTANKRYVIELVGLT